MGEPHGDCRLVAIDRRLSDVHRLWHQAEEAYFDPDAFRTSIQGAIQTLRTVTFLLQSNKRLIPDFDPWYQEWRDRFGADPLMRWMVDARNRIEKQGDLEAHSFVRAEVIASYLPEGPAIEVPADLFQPIAGLLASIPENDLGEHIKKHGFLRIERRWVENTLPDYELLEAVATAYGNISLLVDDAHRQCGLPVPSTVNEERGEEYPRTADGRLPCMVGHGESRVLDFALADGATYERTQIIVPLDREAAEENAKRYEVPVDQMFAKVGGLEDQLRSLFETARKVTETDGYHITIVFLYREGRPVHLMQVAPADQAAKFIMMRELAHEVTRRGADSLIMMGEMWTAKAEPAQRYKRASEYADRKEQLAATLVRREGEPIHLSAEIRREGEKVTLGDTEEARGGAHLMFAPVYDAWGKLVPADWLAMPESDGRPASAVDGAS